MGFFCDSNPFFTISSPSTPLKWSRCWKKFRNGLHCLALWNANIVRANPIIGLPLRLSMQGASSGFSGSFSVLPKTLTTTRRSDLEMVSKCGKEHDKVLPIKHDRRQIYLTTGVEGISDLYDMNHSTLRAHVPHNGKCISGDRTAWSG